MKSVILIFIIGFSFLSSSAQENSKTVSIIVTGSGKTQDDARQSALRSAIEQSFGTFISSKTEILNDKLVSDQITSIANGNIQSFEVLNENQLSDGTWGNTLKAIVSIDKLVSFVQAKGISIEVQGGLFALNIKQQALNESAEINAVYQLVGMTHELLQTAFDYKISNGEPLALDGGNKNWKIPLGVTVFANANSDAIGNYFINSLKSICLSETEKQNYKSLNKPVFDFTCVCKDQTYRFSLRKQLSLNIIKGLVLNTMFYKTNFSVYRDNLELIENDPDNYIQRNYNERFHDYIQSDYIEKSQTDRLFNVFRMVRQNSFFSLKFFSEGTIVSKITWDDFLSIEQIGKLNKYSIISKGKSSEFREGGYIISENNGHGLVATFVPLGLNYFNDAENICSEFSILGFHDFRLPTNKELSLIGNTIISKKIWSLECTELFNIFWTTKKILWDRIGIIFKPNGDKTWKSKNNVLGKEIPVIIFSEEITLREEYDETKKQYYFIAVREF